MRAWALAIAAALAGPAWAAPAKDADEQAGRRVQVLLREHQGEIYTCVGKQPPPVEGEALLRVIVGREGPAARVEVLKVEEGKPAVRAVAECVAAAARRWDLSSLHAAEGDQVVFPLAFKPEVARPQDLALAARMEKLALAANAHQAMHIGFPVAFFVERGTLRVKADGATTNAAAGDVLFFRAESEVEMNAIGATQLIRIEGAGERAEPGPQPVVLRRMKDVKPFSLPGGNGEVRLYLDGVPAPFAVDHLCAKRGATIPLHEHTSDELLYVKNGHATTTIAGRDLTLKGGDFANIPRGTQHAMRADADLCVVQVYAPAGPEQRFKQAVERKAP